MQHFVGRLDPHMRYVGRPSVGPTFTTICTCQGNQKCNNFWLNGLANPHQSALVSTHSWLSYAVPWHGLHVLILNHRLRYSLHVHTITIHLLALYKKKEKKANKKRSSSGLDTLRTRTGPFRTEPTVRFPVHHNLWTRLMVWFSVLKKGLKNRTKPNLTISSRNTDGQWPTIWSVHLVELPYPIGHSRTCGCKYSQSCCSDSNRLLGMCHVVHLRPYAYSLITRIPKTTISLQFMSNWRFWGPSSSPHFGFLLPRSYLTWFSLRLCCWLSSCVCILLGAWGSFSKLIEAARIAIWDKNRTIVAIATGIWGTDIVFLIQGKSLPRSGIDRELSQLWCGIRSRCHACE
jgi:hypothetical protein